MNFFKNNLKKFPLRKNSEDKNGFNQSTPILSKKLRGYYTIKKVINELVPKRILREVNCKRYNDPQLSQIHKGDVAKNATMLRYLSLFSNEVSMTNKDWNETSSALKIYCENDVRAMIAVEKYIKEEFIDKLSKD